MRIKHVAICAGVALVVVLAYDRYKTANSAS